MRAISTASASRILTFFACMDDDLIASSKPSHVTCRVFSWPQVEHSNLVTWIANCDFWGRISHANAYVTVTHNDVTEAVGLFSRVFWSLLGHSWRDLDWPSRTVTHAALSWNLYATCQTVSFLPNYNACIAMDTMDTMYTGAAHNRFEPDFDLPKRRPCLVISPSCR